MEKQQIIRSENAEVGGQGLLERKKKNEVKAEVVEGTAKHTA